MVSAAGPCPLLVPSASLRSLSSSASLCACSQGDEQRDAQEGHHGGHREDLHGGEEGRARGAPCGAPCRVSECENEGKESMCNVANGCGTRTRACAACAQRRTQKPRERDSAHALALLHVCVLVSRRWCLWCVRVAPFPGCRGRGGNYGRVGITARVNLGCANSGPSLSCRIQILHALNRVSRTTEIHACRDSHSFVSARCSILAYRKMSPLALARVVNHSDCESRALPFVPNSNLAYRKISTLRFTQK